MRLRALATLAIAASFAGFTRARAQVTPEDTL
jgi:hypothetical protein